MSAPPVDWSSQLQAAYPRRSGPMGWAGFKLLLAIRHAMLEHTWEDIIDGAKRYKAYCIQAGQEGTQYVRTPLSFFQDGIYAEVFEYQPPQTAQERAKETRAAQEKLEWEREIQSSGVKPFETESIDVYRTRIRSEKLARHCSDGDMGAKIRALKSKLTV